MTHSHWLNHKWHDVFTHGMWLNRTVCVTWLPAERVLAIQRVCSSSPSHITALQLQGCVSFAEGPHRGPIFDMLLLQNSPFSLAIWSQLSVATQYIHQSWRCQCLLCWYLWQFICQPWSCVQIIIDIYVLVAWNKLFLAMPVFTTRVCIIDYQALPRVVFILLFGTYVWVAEYKSFLAVPVFTKRVYTKEGPPEPIDYVCSPKGVCMSQKYVTYRSVQIFRILFQGFYASGSDPPH